MEPLRWGRVACFPKSIRIGAADARHHLHRGRRGGLRHPRRLCLQPEGHLMLANIIWGVGALIIGGYMVVALLKPEKF